MSRIEPRALSRHLTIAPPPPGICYLRERSNRLILRAAPSSQPADAVSGEPHAPHDRRVTTSG